MGSYVDDEEVVSLDVAQQKSIDPDVDKTSNKVDGMTVVAEFDDRFGHVEGSSVFIEEIDSDDDVRCEDDSKGDDSRDGQLCAVEAVCEETEDILIESILIRGSLSLVDRLLYHFLQFMLKSVDFFFLVGQFLFDLFLGLSEKNHDSSDEVDACHDDVEEEASVDVVEKLNGA